MPHKFNADRRDKIPKQKYRVTNWASYNESLRRRGHLTVWVSDQALGLWSAPGAAGRSADIFRPGDRDLPHPERSLQAAAAPDSRIDAQYRGFTGSRDCGA